MVHLPLHEVRLDYEDISKVSRPDQIPNWKQRGLVMEEFLCRRVGRKRGDKGWKWKCPRCTDSVVDHDRFSGTARLFGSRISWVRLSNTRESVLSGGGWGLGGEQMRV